MKKIDPEVTNQVKEMCKESLYFLCTQILWQRNKEFQESWSEVHTDIEVMLKRPSRRKLILVPRGHLKSSIITKAFSIQYLLKNPNARILIANQVWDKAREMLYEIKEYLTTKSQLPILFGDFASDRWNADELVINQRKIALSAPSIGTTGVEAEMTSTHYDVIIADDLQGLNNIQTKEQREKVKRFYRSLLDLLETDGLLIVVGTRWHQDDIYSEIITNESDFYDIMVRKVIENNRIIFPKKFSKRLDTIKKSWEFSQEPSFDYINYLKQSKGTNEFFSQYMNSPINEENQIFKKKYFQYWANRPYGLYIVGTVDLAISTKQESDYTAIVITGMDKDYNIYVLDYLTGHWTPHDIIKNVFDMEMKWHPNVLGVETSGFQRTIKYALEESMRVKRHYFPIAEIKTSNQMSKEFKIKALEPYYRENKIYHAKWMLNKNLEDELLAFPRGRHDDIIDALSMSLEFLLPGQDTITNETVSGSWEEAAKIAREALYPKSNFFTFGA